MNVQIQSILTGILTILGGILTTYLTIYYNAMKAKAEAETQKITNTEQKALVQNALTRVEDLVAKGVGEAEQTLVGDVKAQIAEGTLSKTDLLKIGKDVATTVYGQLSTEAINDLKLEINDIQGFITASVETQVLKLKAIQSGVVNVADAIKPIIEDKTVVETAKEDKSTQEIDNVVEQPTETADIPVLPTNDVAEVVPDVVEVETDTVAPVENTAHTEAVTDVKVDVPVAPVATPIDEIARVDTIITELQNHKAQLVSDAQGTIVEGNVPTNTTA